MKKVSSIKALSNPQINKDLNHLLQLKTITIAIKKLEINLGVADLDKISLLPISRQ